MRNPWKAPQIVSLLLVYSLFWVTGEAASRGASPVSSPEDVTSQQLIRNAAQSVDSAWEEFHQAAIGGTLASPAVQTKIETQLHEARALLMEARKAARRGDHQSVKEITTRLFYLSNEIVEASRERKQ